MDDRVCNLTSVCMCGGRKKRERKEGRKKEREKETQRWLLLERLGDLSPRTWLKLVESVELLEGGERKEVSFWGMGDRGSRMGTLSLVSVVWCA